jgi:hypothetical protein
VASSDGAPLRRAQVLAIASGGTYRANATTDNDGRYAFTDLPAGRYTIRASKGGYVAFAFGQKGFNEPVPPVVLGDGESLTGLTIVLPRGSAITGRVTDEFGEPILQAMVQAMRFQFLPNGERQVVSAGMTATTDDLGQFRLFGLTPGEYVVSANSRNQFIAFPPAELQFANAVNGNVTFTAVGATAGAARGPESAEEGYAATFYPGTINPAEAQPLHVGLGQELTVQIQMVPSRLARVSGVIVDSQGRPVGPGSPIMLRPAANGGPINSRPVNVNNEGAFTFTGVAPGDYVLEVRPRPMPRGQNQAPADPEFAFVPITVSGGDLSGLRIVTGKGATLSGRVVFDGAPPERGTRVRVVPQSADSSRNVPVFGREGSGDGVVGADGSFRVDGIAGPVFLRITLDGGRGDLAQRYMTRSVLIDGIDVADIPFDPAGRASVTGISMVITDKVTEVSGVVADSGGRPLEGTSVLIVPDSLPSGISSTRYVRLLQADANGKFNVRAMPAGRYAAMAFAALDAGHQYDPSVIQRARQFGKSFSMREGDSVTLDLRITSEF